MERSKVNEILLEGDRFIRSFGYVMPPFAYWSPEEMKHRVSDDSALIRQSRLGWDITDYGQGKFDELGLFLFTVRNGSVDDLKAGKGMLYAEKIMIVGENQECPWHYHKVKMEDIIVRGGGNLVIELCNLTEDGQMDRENDVRVRTDGKLNILPAGGKVVLEPGQSVTLPRTLVHRFYGEEGKGPVIVGEVSQVNDDLTDNYFFDCDARFTEIEEDVAPIHPLWNELPSS